MTISQVRQGIASISQSYFEGLKDLQEHKSLSQTVLGIFKCLSYITLITPLVFTALYWATRKVRLQPPSEVDPRVRHVFSQMHNPCSGSSRSTNEVGLRSLSFEEGLTLWVQREGGRAEEAARRIRRAYNSQAQILNLSDLKLKSLPHEIGCLTQLTNLDLYDNELSSLPVDIGRLTQLTWLSLGHNQLSSIPAEIGNLTHLTHLNLSYNYLTELPLSLGQCSQITYLDIERTDVSEERLFAILSLCRVQRDQDALDVLPTRLRAWATYASQDLFDCSIYKEKLTENHLKTLNEWLLRLEKTSDFSSCQSSLAQSVIGILETVLIDESFKESFFTQVEANNEACGDRAAMALNEIFVSWKLATLSSSQCSIEDKLKLLAQTAQTLALRAALQQQLNKLPDGGGKESVEIYLYYETALKNRLNLLTAVSTMRYSAMGTRQEIQESELIEEVQKTYLDHLVDIPAFKSLVDKDPSFQERWKLHEDELSARMEEIEEKKSSMRQQDYVEAMDNLSFEREVQWKKMACEWASSLVSELTPKATEGSRAVCSLLPTLETGSGCEHGA